ncbi:hypothetical protein GOP47_0006723 [Adiantum capillus-veneris]|uniref:Uncharacterized protein n=1 Tax=Adiantum capillus-veneris TaxID=13818 RepID=A0A9D4V465_ADICA|nr:hypothetical protein GOP47_0006126 [Adiantum capillus-veneris]KAI5079052.1 hypothetical protein GOP47_0006723 [Adiantum capillus-veneris]
MFDLNEFPELASDLLVEAEDLKVAPVSSDVGVKESKVSDYEMLPPVLRDNDEASTITVERHAELLHSRSSLSSTLTFEPTLARQHSKASVVHEEDAVEKGDEVGLTVNLRQQQEQLYPQEILQESKDLGNGAHGAVYQFIIGNTTASQINGGSCAEVSTSHKHEGVLDNNKGDPQTSSFFSFNKSMGPHNNDYKHKDDHGAGPGEASPSSRDGSAVQLSLGGASADGSAVLLSLGGISLNSQAHRTQSLARSGSIFKKAEVFGLALGRADDRPPLPSRRSNDLSPFWHGKLRTDAPLLTPVDAYCLGIMKPDSRLKKLPSVLSSQKFLKLEEFMKSLRNGVTEPLTQFKPSLEASSEEVNRFNLMVEALSHGSGLSFSSSVLGLDLGKKKASADGTFPYSAALISWEEDVTYSIDAKLYLISSQCFQELVKNGQPSTSLGALEETDVLDPDSLYGIFCSNSPGHYKDKKQVVDHDAGRNKGGTTSSRRLESSRSTPPLGERGKDTVRSTSPAPPRIRRHLGHSDGLTNTALIETRRVSSRDSNLRSGLEASGRSSKRRLEKQASSIDNTRDVRSRHSSRHNDDLYDDDIDMHAYQKLLSKQREKSGWTLGRHSERLEWRTDRNKDTTRSGKEDRDSGKDRIRDHQRSSHHESERVSKSKTREENRNHDRMSHKERDKSSKDRVSESLKPKLLEKGSGLSKSSSFIRKAASPIHESGKLNRKRERDNDKEIDASSKRSRELEATVLIKPSQLAGEISCDGKFKASVERLDREECLLRTHLERVDKPLSLESNKGFLHLNSLAAGPFLPESDGMAEVKDKEAFFLDEELTKPLLIHTNFDSIIEMNQDAVDLPVCETEGVSEMDTGLSLMEPSWNGSLGVPLQSKADKEEGTVASFEFVLDGPIEKETRTWLISKQNSLYLHEEYGVDTEITSTGMDVSKFDSGVKTDGQNGSDALIGPDIPKLNLGAKTDSQNGPLQVRISMATSEACDAVEAKWFVEQAVSIVKSVALRGVYVKCLWYEGPVQIHSGDGAPSVPVIVKKIKGEDGKNLERMQDETGVMIGVVLRKSGVSTLNEAEPMSRPRFIGLRLKCIRRRGLLEASKEAEALLECVAEHFSKELATHIATHIADLQESAVHCGEGTPNQDPSLSLALSTKELLPSSPVKVDSRLLKSPSGPSSKVDDALITFGDKGSFKLSGAVSFSEDPKADSTLELEGASRPLYVSNLPEHITSSKIRTILESVMKEKLGSSGEVDFGSELVVDVKYKPEKCCAFVELANDRLLRASLKLYTEDKAIFHGLSVEEGLLPFSRAERQGSFSKGATRNRVEHARSSLVAARNGNAEEDLSRRQYRTADNESDSDFSQDVWYADATMRPDYVAEKPRPLYLTELMRNASGPAIKQLFENVINTYIGPSLANASGKQLVLDVRYVPTRGCAFVDLATPELVEFMLDLHSRRPEVFLNMKMELGRKAVPYSADDDGERRLSSRNRDGKYGYRLSSSGSWKKLEKRLSGAYPDQLDDSDKGDDLMRQISRLKKQRSDPEKTIYADRLPESASVGMIKKIFERVLQQNLTREERDAIGEQLITEVRHVPSKYCAFVVFANEELTRLVLELYSQDEDVFECMRLKPHFHSRLEDLYKEEGQEADEVVRPPAAVRERIVNSDIDELLRLRESDIHDLRSSRLAVQRAISATAFKEVDRRRSVYVDRIPEDLNEVSMTQLFEKVFRHKKHGYDGHMVSQVAYFRDKFDPSKLCAFVEIKTEEGTQDLVDFYNANQDAFHGMRVRPGFKYNS